MAAALKLVSDEEGNRAARRLPKRIEKLDLKGTYDGFHITAWINYPGRLREDMRSGDEAKVSAALKQIVIDHDLIDFDCGRPECEHLECEGRPLPPATDATFWTEAPDDLGFAIIGAIRDQFGKLPKESGAR